MMVFKRKQIVAGMLAVMVGIVGYLSYSYNNETKDTLSETVKKKLGEATYVSGGANAISNDYFEGARIAREKARGESKQILESIINNEKSDQSSKEKAQNDLISIAMAVQNESACENLIKSKGFSDVLVTISDNKVNILVKTEGLIPAQIAQIRDIVMGQTNIAADNIIISEAL